VRLVGRRPSETYKEGQLILSIEEQENHFILVKSFRTSKRASQGTKSIFTRVISADEFRTFQFGSLKKSSEGLTFRWI
jgi:hypothetical protein